MCCVDLGVAAVLLDCGPFPLLVNSASMEWKAVFIKKCAKDRAGEFLAVFLDVFGEVGCIFQTGYLHRDLNCIRQLTFDVLTVCCVVAPIWNITHSMDTAILACEVGHASGRSVFVVTCVLMLETSEP